MSNHDIISASMHNAHAFVHACLDAFKHHHHHHNHHHRHVVVVVIITVAIVGQGIVRTLLYDFAMTLRRAAGKAKVQKTIGGKRKDSRFNEASAAPSDARVPIIFAKSIRSP